MEQVYDLNCPACAELERKGIFYVVRKGRAIRISENFLLLPALGSLIRYYLVLVPKVHYLSFSKLPDPLLIEATELLQKFISDFPDFYFVLTEHGENSKSVEHAHISVLAFQDLELRNLFLKEIVSKLKPELVKVSGLEDLFKGLKRLSRVEDYTWVYVPGDKLYLVKSYTRPQLVRRVLAKIAGIPIWNWQADLHLDTIEEAYKVFGEVKYG